MLLATLFTLTCMATDEVALERAELQERLEAERRAFDSLGTERHELLSLLETLERLARDASARVAGIEKQRQRLDRRRVELAAELEKSSKALRTLEAELAPRLVTLARVQRRSGVSTLLSASDFATAIRGQRALSALVASDVRALESVAVVAQYQGLVTRRLERLEQANARYLRALRTEQQVGQARLARFADLLASVSAEQNRMSRLIAELEASERELSSMVSDLSSTTTQSGFRARKGKLPFPTQGGLVEVGFGKVVNPRFNTVTVQKGIDLRAASGSPVSAVASGTVVFAGWLKGYGNLVIVDHGTGYHSLYAHLAEMEVEPGTELEEGVTVGTVGDTGSLKGAFLYFEIRKQGQAIDPLPWLAPVVED